MRLTLYVDNLASQIDTRDPDLLARWLLEQFALIRWTPATLVRAQAWPSWSDLDDGGKARADWLTNSVDISERWDIKTPEHMVEALTDALVRGRVRERTGP